MCSLTIIIISCLFFDITIAPTNDAFAALPEGTVETLLLPENIDALTGILTYHVVAAEVLSTDLVNGDVETLNGASVTVNLDDGVKINDSNVITADIQACNGIIHVIDAVLLPPADEEPETLPEEDMSMSMPECQGIVDIAVGNPDFSTLVAAVQAAGLVDALSGDGPLTVFGTYVLSLVNIYLYTNVYNIICTHYVISAL